MIPRATRDRHPLAGHDLTVGASLSPVASARGSASNGELRLGARLRTARLRRQLSIDNVAASAGLTKGFISQLERDMAAPSVASLIRLCGALQISVGSLFDPPTTNLVRRADRPRINFGGEHLVEHLLTPRGNDYLQVIESHIEPGGGSGDEAYSLEASAEVVHVLSGTLEVTVRDERHVLAAGDTLTFSGRDPHTWRNTSADQPVDVLWILAPSPW